MKVSIAKGGLPRVRVDLVAVPVLSDEDPRGEAKKLIRRLGRPLQREMERSGFTGEEGQSLTYQSEGKNWVFLGLGKRADLTTEAWRRFGYRSARSAADRGAEKLACYLPIDEADSVTLPVAEGVRLASYRFDRYKSEKEKSKKKELGELVMVGPTLKADREDDGRWRKLEVVAKAVFLARDLVNEPASFTTPTRLAEQAKALAKEGLAVEVWDKRRLAAEKFNGTLAVSRGSSEEPRFIKLTYRPPAKAAKGERGARLKKVALVGKGITFDSGGLSLKPAKSMETMKTDMAGAAAVLGVMSAVAKLRPMVEVTGYVPAAENLPGGGAQKPGDVITFLNGKSVEVLNTDAEGRLILADALCYASRAKPDVLVDLATLTGACMVALGVEVAGIMGNDQALIDRLIALGREAGEPLWQLPLVKDYREDIKGTIADIKNVGSGYGGTITAGLFLQEFVDCPSWAHLDIAGPAFVEKDFVWASKGGTGFGVRTLVRFIEELGQGG